MKNMVTSSSSFKALIIATLALSACQKGGGGSSADPAAQAYTFTGPLDQLSGSYNYNGFVRNVTSGQTMNTACSTGNISFTTRTQLCAVVRDEARNFNCAYDQRQQVFQQYCVNANTSNLSGQPFNANPNVHGGLPNQNPNQGPIPYPVKPGPSVGPIGSTGPLKLVTCSTETQSGNSSGFSNAVRKTQTKMWNTTEPSTISFSKSWFTNSGEALISLMPAVGKNTPQIKIAFAKSTTNTSDKARKMAAAQGSIDTVIGLAVTDDEDQRQTSISCSVTSGQSLRQALGKTLSCEGNGIDASGRKFKFAQAFPWDGQNISESLVLGKDESNVLNVTAAPGLGGQPAQISLEIPHNDHDLDVKTVMALTNSTSQLLQKEPATGFFIDVKCRLVP